ncbi:MAG: alanine/ornithine racemase family PLP-dependent enzyme [Clostridia bacterium]|nr:alanine/ornithine racemase family PLP-dependent enzyme [Clostridia bacterium]
MVYPNLIIRLDYIQENAASISQACFKHAIDVCGVVKGLHSEIEVAKAMVSGGVRQIGDARLENLKKLKNAGINVPLLLTRIPMLSEIEALVDFADISLNSEIKTIEAINEVCMMKKRSHKVVLMYDLGDLREGFIDQEQLLHTAIQIEDMDGVILEGIGTNLGCYGSVKPTIENLSELVLLANRIESQIGRKLNIVSGGATSTLPMVLEGSIPKGINHLRIGESILLARDLPDLWHVPLPFTHKDTVVVKAQIVELKRKPSHPIGELFLDAFGNRPTFEDRGMENRAIVALGRQDFAYMDQLIPVDKELEMIGCSSDHLIIRIPDDSDYKIGDVLSFETYYGAMLFLSGADHIHKTFIK